MPRFGLTPNACVQYACVIISVAILVLCQGATVNQVSIEDFIDLDDNPMVATKSPHNKAADTDKSISIQNLHSNNNNDLNILIKNNEHSIQKGVSHNILSLIDTRNDVILDDEDFVASGSGSGSGDFVLDVEQNGDGDVLTDTKQIIKKEIGVSLTEPHPKPLEKEGHEAKNKVEIGREEIENGQGKKKRKKNKKNKKKKKKEEEDGVKEAKEENNNDDIDQIRIEDLVGNHEAYVIDEDDWTRGKSKHSKENNNNNNKNEYNNIVISRGGSRVKKDPRTSVIIKTTKNEKSESFSSKNTKSLEDDDDDDGGEDDVNDNDERMHKDEGDDDKSNETVEDPSDDDKRSEYGHEEDYQYFYDYSDGDDDDESYDEDEDEDDDADEESYYDLKNMQSDDANTDKLWSKWRKVGQSTKVRVKKCEVKGQTTKGKACDRLELQVKSCGKDGRCGIAQNMRTSLAGDCDSVCKQRNETTQEPMSIITPTSPSPTPTLTPMTPPTPQGCQYSLFDKKRRKYVFVRWDVSQVLTRSKVKRWCRKGNDQYMVMVTPRDDCKKYLHDICQASQKCKSNKPPRERGDFAEGCWRGLVFGDMLPIGLSNRQTIIYFICQRYSSDSAMGRVFGYKDTHFGTLYDTKIRAPVLSLHKMLQVGDETWPESDYLIEHGLIEQKKDVMWLFSRHRKGIVSLRDLDRCYNDQPCDLGRFQTMPGDYSSESGNTAYTPIPLIWPEWMDMSLDARTATLTTTNTVPILSSIREEWHSVVKSIRAYAIEECGVPYISDPNVGYLGQLSSHRSNKSALYLASGAIPTIDPVIKTGREIPVPSHIWVAGCCVQKLASSGARHVNDVIVDDEETSNTDTSISSFSFYIKNQPGNHVTQTSIFRLERMLQDFYKVKAADPDVSVFPGLESSCSDLKNDVSGWF